MQSASAPHNPKRHTRRPELVPGTHAAIGGNVTWGPYVLVAAASLLYLVLKLYAVNVVVGDEHLYFNMALLVNKGLVPHRDFFYTHPPLHLYLAAFAFKLFGYSLALGKSLSISATLIGGLLVFAVGRRALGAAEGAVAGALFLLSYDPLRISSHFTGGNEAFAFAMGGLCLAYLNRPVLAGCVFGLGLLVAVYVGPGAGVAALLLFWRSRRAAMYFVMAVAAVVLAGNLLLYAMAGWDYIYQVYLTQFEKGKEGGAVGYTLYHRLGFIMYENRLLTAGSVAGLVLLALDVRSRLAATPRRRVWEDARGEALLVCVAWFVFYWVFYLSIALQVAYYFLFIMPVFAWFSAYAYLQIGRGVLHALRPATLDAAPERARRRAAPRVRAARLAPLIPAVVGLILTFANVGMIEALYVPYALRRYGTAVRHFAWQPLRSVAFLDPWVRGAFWQQDYDPRHPPSGIARYLQHESEQITVADQIYAAVRQHSAADEAIFGEVGFVPVVSSETGRRVAGNLIDTSTYRITYGLSRIEDWIATIEADQVKVLVGRPGSSPMRYPQFKQYAQTHFRTVARIRDPREGVFEIMRRIEP